MAVTSQQIIDFLLANPGMSDAQIVAAMEQYGVSPAQMAQAVGLKEGEVAARVGAAIPPNQAVLLGDTYVQAVNQVTGSGENEQVGALENVITYKASENKVGGNINYYSPTGEYQQTTQQQEVNATKDFLKFAAVAGGMMFGLPPGLGEAAAVGSTGLTAAEIASLTATDLAIGGGGLGAFAPLTAAEIAALTATDLAIGAGTPSAASTAGLLTPAALTPAALTPAAAATTIPAAVSTVAPTAAVSALTPTATNIATSLLPAAVKGLLTPTNIGNLISGGLGTAGNLLQMQQSKEAAHAAQQRIDAETAAAKQSAAFRPVGMTTRFGTSQFGYDPTTGQMTSAGYTLSPEAKAQQDRFVALSNQGLTQAEGAQAQFAPLQTGAQSLFNLGNQYISQTPQSVAENYLKQQMALLQPGRETELANLQTKLRNQGRMGLSVSQGGNLGATTPELQALYNARAQQEAVLAANAQQAGQQQVLYGAGLLGQGSQAMGQYYGGQQAAYAPYATAQGQVQNLESLGQQPFNMSNALAQQTSLAGARTGQLGLTGAQLSTNLATSNDATRNLLAQGLRAAGNPNAMFGQAIGSTLGGLFGSQPATSGFSYGQYGTGVDPSTGEYFGSLYF